jgi:predicted CopG family antitoxin
MMGYIGLSHAKLSAAANRELLSKIDEISDVTEVLRNLWTVWKVESYRRSFTAEICQIRANPRMLLFRKRMYATIPMPVGGIMKRTTVFPDEDVLRKLREVAKRENNTVSEVIRKALSEYVSQRSSKRSRLSLIGIGRSGRKDVAERAEELLFKASGR